MWSEYVNNDLKSFWRKWWDSENKESFARAFLALGTLPLSRKLRSDINKLLPETELNIGLAEELKAVTEAEMAQAEKGKAICWQFPKPDQFFYTRKGRISLLKLDPKILSDLWEKLPWDKLTENKLRFRIKGYPNRKLISFWHELIDLSPFVQKSGYIVCEFKDAKIHMKWPLRLGWLPDNQVEEIVDNITNDYTLNKVTKPVKIGREEANCDILVFKGDIGQLAEAVKDTNVPMKCNLCVIKGKCTDQSADIPYEKLNEISAGIHAGGFVFVSPDISDDDFRYGLSNMIFSVCHNETLDTAISGVYLFKAQEYPLVFLKETLADFHVHEQFIKTINRVKALPYDAKIEFDRDPFHKMGFTMSKKPETIYELKEAINENAACMLPEYEHEEGAATSISLINDALDKSVEPVKESAKSEDRFLQASTFIKKEDDFQEEKRAFVKGVKSRIQVGIGFYNENKLSLGGPTPIRFPVEELPENEDVWHLKVVLSEPDHLKKPLRGDIKLPKYGQSTWCDFDFIPVDKSYFEGRLVILHRGRILQTGLLKAEVAAEFGAISDKSKIILDEIIPVRVNLGNLKQRRQFDLAFVTNHHSNGIPQLTAVSENHAWLSELASCGNITTEINSVLTDVANSVDDYKGDIDSKNNTDILVKLAKKGAALRRKITNELEAPTNKAAFAKLQLLQIVTTRDDQVIPFEFIYDFLPPKNTAGVCKKWKQALTDIIDMGDIEKVPCYKECAVNKSDFVCPLGFWGIQKVIERHRYSPWLAKDGKFYFLQSVETVTNRDLLPVKGSALVAASENVEAKDLEPVIAACSEKLGAPPRLVKNWEEWVEVVKEIRPKVILTMPHTAGKGTDVTLEINGNTMESNLMEDGYIRAGDADYYPLVALLGCDTAGTAQNYGSHVTYFTEFKSAVVIGTIASVFGRHAANVTKMFVEGLSDGVGRNERLGEVIRYIKQKSLLEGMVMPLCVVAFGDADWRLQ